MICKKLIKEVKERGGIREEMGNRLEDGETPFILLDF